MKKNKKNNRGKVFLILFLTFLLICASIFAFGLSQLSANDYENSSFEVVKNAGSKDIFMDLEEAGFIKNGTIAYYYARLFENADFKAGKYEIPEGLSVKEMIAYLSDGKNTIQDTVSITFIEGDWLKDFALKISNATSLSYDECMNYWNDETVLNSLISKYPFLTEEIFNEDIRYPLEGYFFPNTYEFFADSTIEQVTTRLLDATLEIYQKYESDFNNSPFSTHEIFTLASVVQYEASTLKDMQGVAGVFFNRMEIGMQLQSSVTVCYAIDIEPDEDWVACEQNSNFDSPYNTYLVSGLPPGPILNPGEDAIYAVLNPTEHDYYFFIGDVCGDGTVYFAETYAKHLQLVKEYLWCY